MALDRRRHYHVIIGLDGNPAPHLGDIPYRTVVLEWAAQEAFDEGGVEGAYRYLMHELRELMTTLGVRDEE